MKTINIIIKSVLILGVALGLASCNKYKYEEVVQSFKVLETNYSNSSKASEGSIRVNQEGFSVATDGDWLQAEVSEATLVKVLISENANAEARTANVILKKGEEVQRVPIMQMGIENYVIDLGDLNFKIEGEVREFSAKFDDKAVFTLVPEKAGEPTDWLSYELKDGKLILTAAALPQDIGARSLDLMIEAGAYTKTIKVSQKFLPSYEDVLGTYTIDYYAGVNYDKAFEGLDPKTVVPRSQAEVVITEKEKGKSFTLTGLAYPCTLLWDEKEHAVSVPTQDVLEVEKGKKYITLSVSGNGYKKVEDGKVDWGFYDGSEMKGFWKEGTSKAHLRFDFPPCKGLDGKGNIKTAEVHGLFFWIYIKDKGWGGSYKGDDGKGIGILSDFFLVKK